MKKKNKGFMLIETLVVSTFIVTTLIYLYVQFVNLKANYDKSFKYDTVPGLYNAKEIDKFINNNYGLGVFFNYVDKSDNGYIEIYNQKCNLSYFSDKYCDTLLSNMDVKYAFLSKSNLDGIIENLQSKKNYSNNLLNYIKNIDIKIDEKIYIIIVEYNDGTFASINIEKGEE